MKYFACFQRYHIRERSLSVVNMFLEEMAKEAKNIITTICDEQCILSDKVWRLSNVVTINLVLSISSVTVQIRGDRRVADIQVRLFWKLKQVLPIIPEQN